MTVHLPSYWRRGYFGSLNVSQNWIGFLLKISRRTKKSEAAACCWEATPGMTVKSWNPVFNIRLGTRDAAEVFVCVCVFFLGRRAVTCFCYGRRAARRSGVVTQTGETVGAEELTRAVQKNASEVIFGLREPSWKTYISHSHFIHFFFFFFSVRAASG